MRSQNRKVKITRPGLTSASVGRASCLGLLALSFMLVNPIVSSAYAEEVENYGVASQALASSTVVIEFSPATASGSLTPVDASGAKTKVDVLATVKVANSAGFRVYVGSDTSDLVNKSCPSTATADQCKVQSVASAVDYANLPNNRWGYAFVKNGTSSSDTTVYSPMPSSVRDTALDTVNETNRQEKSFSYLLSFAANIDADRPAGTYENQVTMSVVSSPLEITNAFGIEYMQDMTASICNSIATPAADASITDVPATQLIDKRDGKKYWVAKLADGNCWMTQNLDLDIPAEGFPDEAVATNNMTWQNSDMATAWTNPTTETLKNSIVAYDSKVYTESRSWDQGLYILSTPTAGTNCNDSTTGSGLATDACEAAGFVNVSNGYTASTEPDFYTRTSYIGTQGGTCTKTVNTAVSTATAGECAQYDAHYLVGNWYQWNAATAGTGGTLQSAGSSGSVTAESDFADAPSSICPKGWHLPKSGRNGSNNDYASALTRNDSFKLLLMQYNTSDLEATDISVDISVQPILYFFRGGYVSGNGFLQNPGSSVGFWSATAYTEATAAYDLYVSGLVKPSDHWTRSVGLFVRCLAR